MSLFSVSEKDNVTTIQCPSELNSAAAAEFTTLSQGWTQTPSKLYVVDFMGVKKLDRPIFRAFMLFHQALKNAGCFLASIHAAPEVLAVLQANGLDSALSPKKNLQEAMSHAGIQVSRQKIDVEFINPFVRATQVTLETQANTRVKIGKPYLKKEEKISFDIAGVISLTSNAFKGSIALCFPAKVFLAIYSNLLGEKHDVITKEIEDAAGEILNIIFGQAKAELNHKAGYQIQKAIPTIVRGTNLEVHHLTRNVAVILPFETDSGVFHLEISTEAS